MQIPSITFCDSRSITDKVYVDVRAPVEYTNDHIPDAVNYPLLDDEQREYIGTLYHTRGRDEALMEGIEIVSPKLKPMVSFFSLLSQSSSTIIVYCFRGGMRSESVVSFLNSIGFNLFKLEGGYKAYRQFIRNYLTNYCFTIPVVTVYGLAGSGKTHILHHNPYSLDLEGCAGNRSSLFGSLGMPDHSQKYFESRIVHILDTINVWPYCLLEGESRKIGNCHIPPIIMDAMQKGIALWLNTPIDVRIQHIYQEYMPFITEEAIVAIMDKLQPALGKTKTQYCKQLFCHGKYLEFIQFLLHHHYDPEYQHSIKNISFTASINYTEPHDTANTIDALIHSMLQ